MISLALACLWIIAAKVIAIFPSRDHHWRAAYILMAIGVPILIWITLKHGVLPAIVALLAGAWVLRWPVYYMAKWLRRLVRGE